MVCSCTTECDCASAEACTAAPAPDLCTQDHTDAWTGASWRAEGLWPSADADCVQVYVSVGRTYCRNNCRIYYRSWCIGALRTRPEGRLACAIGMRCIALGFCLLAHAHHCSLDRLHEMPPSSKRNSSFLLSIVCASWCWNQTARFQSSTGALVDIGMTLRPVHLTKVLGFHGCDWL